MKKFKKTIKSGFTLVETIIVIGIISLIGLSAFVFLNGTRSKGLLKEAQAALIGILETARSYAINGVGGVGNENYKIILNSNKVSLYQGANEISSVLLPAGISLNSNISEFFFERIKGNASTASPVIINLIHSLSCATTSVTISREGKIE